MYQSKAGKAHGPRSLCLHAELNRTLTRTQEEASEEDGRPPAGTKSDLALPYLRER